MPHPMRNPVGIPNPILKNFMEDTNSYRSIGSSGDHGGELKSTLRQPEFDEFRRVYRGVEFKWGSGRVTVGGLSARLKFDPSGNTRP